MDRTELETEEVEEHDPAESREDMCPEVEEQVSKAQSREGASEQDVREVENIQPQRVCEDLLDHVHESQRDQRERLVKTDLVEELQTTYMKKFESPLKRPQEPGRGGDLRRSSR